MTARLLSLQNVSCEQSKTKGGCYGGYNILRGKKQLKKAPVEIRLFQGFNIYNFTYLQYLRPIVIQQAFQVLQKDMTKQTLVN